MTLTNIRSFLEFGYFLDYVNPDFQVDFSSTDKAKYQDMPEEEMLDTGIRFWKEAMQEQYVSGEQHVVPLSGGLDSRAILATLLESFEAKDIMTYTYGTPGTYDWDIGNDIARRVGTNHHKLPLADYNYNTLALVDISKRIQRQTVLFHHGAIDYIDKVFSGAIIWSGAVIDVFFGRHNHKNLATNWNNAILNSFTENQYVKSTSLTKGKYQEYIGLVDYDPAMKGILELEHVIDLMNRQTKFVAPHVLMKGMRHNNLLRDKLTAFACSIPNHHRKDQSFYKKMFLRSFPELFSLPTKTSYGLPLNASATKLLFARAQNRIARTFGLIADRNTNYMDFNEKIRSKDDLKHVIKSNVLDLKKRNIIDWIDVDQVLGNHLAKRGDHADALIVLASLEIHFKSGLQLPE